jgi:diguanylate cyclase (GGDEF)-like protein
MTQLDSDTVLDAVVESTLLLGFDAAAIATFSADLQTFRFWRARGFPDELVDDVYPCASGVVPLARENRETIVITDYPSHPRAVPLVSAAGFKAMIASPLISGDEVIAVLMAASKAEIVLGTDEINAFELLTANSVRALENAQSFETQHEIAKATVELSLIDELTGLGNRRQATMLLRNVRRGDALMLLDLDNFKRINDTEGHIVGDQVLTQLGQFLKEQLRGGDYVARYGGEEFLAILPAATQSALMVAQRLLDAWRATRPRTTMSIGIAIHLGAEPAMATLDRADMALYHAKRNGRDRTELYSVDLARTDP